MLEWLLKYPLESFREAEWVFESGRSSELLLVVIGVVAIAIAFSLWRVARHIGADNSSGASGAGLLFTRLCGIGLLQAVFAGVLLLMFWQPALKVDSVAAGDNTVAILLDNSRSMYFDAESGRAATAGNTAADISSSRIGRTLAAIESSDLVNQLEKNFSLKMFRLDGDSSEIASTDFKQAEVTEQFSTSPAENPPLLQHLLDTLQSGRDEALAGVVLATDGAIDSSRLDAAWWRQLAAYGIPVYPVLTGQRNLPGEVELSKVDLPARATPGSAVPVTVTVTYDLPAAWQQSSALPAVVLSGEAGGSAAENDGSAVDPVVAAGAPSFTTTLRVFDGQALLLVEEVPLPSGQQQVSHIAEFTAPESGLMDLRFELQGIQTTSGEQISTERHLANNTQRRVLPVSGGAQRVLYIEGEPRWEYKFIRRALSGYPGVELVSLLRTSPNKLYRQGVKNERELVDGFPATKEELFSYDALIIGSLEAAYLNAEQQRNIRQFVRERGGSLLMLGGKSGLGDGGWGRSEVAQALPAVLDQSSNTFQRQRRAVRLTALGEQTDWLRLSGAAEDNVEAWSGLPEVADVQTIGELKPGASVLLQIEEQNSEADAMPLLLWQRYGRGKSYLMATSGTWRWQMSLPSDDERHELFWQGFASHLVDGVLPRLALSADQAVYMDESNVSLQLDWRDEQFVPSSNVNLVAEVVSPSGASREIVLQAHESIVGRFATTVDASEPGAWQVNVNVEGEDDSSHSIWFMREDQRAEDFGLRSNDALMQRIARETGGQVASADDLAGLPDMLGDSEALLVRHSALSLWNMPLFFLLLLVSKMTEWFLRWQWGRI